MKRKFVILLMGLLFLTACGNQKQIISTEDKQNLDSYESYEIQTDNNQQEMSQSEEPEKLSMDLFPEQLQGYYGSYSNEYVSRYYFVESNQITMFEDGNSIVFSVSQDDVFETSNSTAEYEEFHYGKYDYDNNYNIEVRFLISKESNTISAGFQVNSLDGTGEYEYSTQLYKTDVVFGMPTEQYQSLDNQGKYGAIPFNDKIETLMVEQLSEDFFILFQKDVEIYAGDESIKANMYTMTSFDEEGYVMPKSIMVYETVDVEEAQSIYNSMNNGYTQWEIDENLVIGIYENTMEIRKEFLYSKQYYVGNYYTYMVFGEHCFKDKDMNWYYYLSKPYTLEDGQRFVEATKLLHQMWTSSTSQDGLYSIQLSDSGMKPYISIYDNAGTINISYLGNVKAVDQKLYFYGHIYGLQEDDSYTGDTYVVVIEKNEQNLDVTALKYEGMDQVNYDNYDQFTPIFEVQFTAPIITY